MRVLLSFGDPQIMPVQLGHDVGEDVTGVLARQYEGKGEALVVLRHGYVLQAFRRGRVKRNCRIAVKRHAHFAAAVRPKVVEHGGVLVADQPHRLVLGIDNYYRLDELVGNAFLIRAADGFYGVGRLLALAVHQGIERPLYALPALVAIHGVVAARDSGDAAHADLADLLLQLFHVPRAALGRGVAAVHEAVDTDILHAFSLRDLQQRVQVRVHGVHTAVALQPHQMQAMRAGVSHQIADYGVIA